jgi:hypothetical protein
MDDEIQHHDQAPVSAAAAVSPAARPGVWKPDIGCAEHITQRDSEARFGGPDEDKAIADSGEEEQQQYLYANDTRDEARWVKEFYDKWLKGSDPAVKFASNEYQESLLYALWGLEIPGTRIKAITLAKSDETGEEYKCIIPFDKGGSVQFSQPEAYPETERANTGEERVIEHVETFIEAGGPAECPEISFRLPWWTKGNGAETVEQPAPVGQERPTGGTASGEPYARGSQSGRITEPE